MSSHKSQTTTTATTTTTTTTTIATGTPGFKWRSVSDGLFANKSRFIGRRTRRWNRRKKTRKKEREKERKKEKQSEARSTNNKKNGKKKKNRRVRRKPRRWLLFFLSFQQKKQKILKRIPRWTDIHHTGHGLNLSGSPFFLIRLRFFNPINFFLRCQQKKQKLENPMHALHYAERLDRFLFSFFYLFFQLDVGFYFIEFHRRLLDLIEFY